MRVLTSTIIAASILAGVAFAAPAPEPDVEARQLDVVQNALGQVTTVAGSVLPQLGEWLSRCVGIC